MTWAPTISEYHADTSATGSTLLGWFRDDPALYHGRITGEIELPKVEKPMIYGSLAHVLAEAMEPGQSAEWAKLGPFAVGAVRKFAGATLAVAPLDARRGSWVKRGVKTSWADHLAEHDALACTRPERDVVVGGLLALVTRDTPQARLARWLLIDCPGRREFSYRWMHKSGVECKVRYDSLPDSEYVGEKFGIEDPFPCFVDLKFTGKPDKAEFERSTFYFDRHCQGGLYATGYHELYEEWPTVFYVAIGSAPPHKILVHALGEKFLRKGVEQIEKDLEALAQCRKTGRWFAPDELAKGVSQLEPPRWLQEKTEITIDTF